MKALLLLLLLTQDRAHGNPAIDARSNAMQSMQAFNPQDAIPHYTSAPPESNINPNDNQNRLQTETNHRLTEEKTAQFVIDQEKKRVKITPNSKATEIEYAEHLIDEADHVIHPACHKEQVPCEEHVTEKTCEERAIYEPLICRSHLVVNPNQTHHSPVRRLFGKSVLSINLTRCDGALAQYCNTQQLIYLSSRCNQLDVHVRASGIDLPVTHKPTCEDPTILLDRTFLFNNKQIPNIFWTDIEVIEYGFDDDRWDKSDCSALSYSFCALDSANPCMEPNQTKIIKGIPVFRNCWGEERHYQCVRETTTTCTPLLNSHCSNTKAECTAFTGDHCDVTSKTFQCSEKVCFPDKEVCPPEIIACANGSCDNSVAEESDDIQEGISRLGAVSGTADDIADNQIQTHQPSIFKGAAQECETYILGLRDCCTDDGILDGLIHCPADMQVLQHAKLEHRAVYLGHYKHHVLGTTRFAYCIFPTKLAGIVQIQGRLNQLQIPFGKAEEPDCRGLTPEELERIDFKVLDLHDIVDELLGKRNLPSNTDTDAFNTSHIESLHDKGRAHD